MNVEIIDVVKIAPTENTQNIDIISECIEPSVIYKGQMLHKARIIKTTNK